MAPARAFAAARLRRFLLAVLAAAVLTVAASPLAQADGSADEAELHFRLGAESYQNGKYREALEHFLLSNRLVPNRNVVYNIARTFERMGRFADAYRYYVDALATETDAKVKGDVERAIARIAPEVAVLRVKSTPPGAKIYLDRRDLGTRGIAPRPLALAPGKHKVIAVLPGYTPAEVDGVVVRKGKETTISLELQRIVGTVEVGLRGGEGAKVRVDAPTADVACVAPCELKLAPGLHVLHFDAPGYRAAPQQVVVKARQTAKVTASLTTLRGALVVETGETGAVVEVDGEVLGYTPAVVQNVPVGERKVRVSLRGFKPVERTVRVEADTSVRLTDLELVPVREVQAVSRQKENVDAAPSSLTVIDGRELRAMGYPTIASALRGVRGVYLTNDRTYESAGIRGIGSPNDYGNRVLVLHDGLSMNDNLLNSSYIGSDARADLHDIERIEVIRGPGSLLYGTGAFSGVINLVPRDRDRPTQVFGGFGTYDNAVARGRAGFHVNFDEDAGIWASTTGARSQGFTLPVTLLDPGTGAPVQNADQTDRFRAVGTHGRAWYGDLNAQWLFHRRKQNIPVGALGASFGDPRTFYLDERFAGEIRYEPSLDWVDVSTRAHANHYHFGGRYISDAPDPALEEDLYGTWFGGEARARFKPLDELHITVGGEGQFHPIAKLQGAEVDPAFNPLVGGEYLDEDRPFNFGAAYALVEVMPVEWFTANAGARVDVYSTFGPIVVPRGALIFRPTDGGVLKVMGGRAFRAPSIYEQFYNDGAFSQAVAVDDARGLDLGPESIVSGEVEYLQRFLDDYVAVAAIHGSYVEDIINTIADAPGSDVIRYANSDAPVYTLGGDVELRREFRRGWMASVFYSYQRAEFLDPEAPALQANPRLINAPEHMAGARGIVPLVTELASLGMRGTLEAPRRISYADDATTDLAIIVDTTLSGRVNAYGVAYTVGVYNLFDWRFALPVADTFASRTITQNGRTFLLDVSIAYP